LVGRVLESVSACARPTPGRSARSRSTSPESRTTTTPRWPRSQVLLGLSVVGQVSPTW